MTAPAEGHINDGPSAPSPVDAAAALSSSPTNSSTQPPSIPSQIDMEPRSSHDTRIDYDGQPSPRSDPRPLDQTQSHESRSSHDSHHDDHHGTTVAPTPDSRTEAKVKLSDQTNYLPRKQVILVFAGLSCALFIALLDQTIVSTALPTITRAFGAGADASWLSTSYLLTSTAVCPLYGRFSDIFGRKVCMVFSLSLFLVGSILCSAAQSMTQLIVFRAIAGVGGGGIITLVMVIVSDVVSLRERGTYQGVLGMVVAISNSGGPLVGGALASANWRLCFIIAIPIIVLALVAVILLLPLKKVEGSVRSKLAKIDYLGVALVLAGTVLMLLGLNWGGQTFPWTDARVLGTLISGGVLYLVFAYVEAKVVPLPLVPMRLFRNRTVASVLVQTACSGGIFYLLLFFVPQYTQVVKGFSGILAGVCLIPLMALQAVTSTAAGILVSKTGRYKAFIVGGFAIFSVGVGLLALLDVDTPTGEVIGFLILAGFGAGGTLQTTLVAAQNAVDRKDLAVVTSTRNFTRLFGGVLALAASYTILNNSVRNHLRGVDESVIRQVISDPTSIRTGPFSAQLREELLAAYVAAFRNVFYFGLAMILVAFLLTLFFLEELPLDKADDKQRKEEGKQWIEERKSKKQARKQGHDVEAAPAAAGRGEK
ncbi:uncharacterized protein PFL1_00791 [Pseudozyma flocculosa PF-1]|uniref:Related to tetracycline efflux protein (Otrb) n=1 Tax=Pseudozyma flocculosa TaxID=84751 RepID=A0A5C3F696_9BASI|nr:uncharacterized protein PFL1_00791 [Pseudozyma flocculosa PF-1]EPQ31456.1 hypothetical protein PFL1_00791 [Pseudozyma flocculosa PF-1]SPO38761.1 related to tetracycline efflux protein (otrb) [Pseudozyma flocculosa]